MEQLTDPNRSAAQRLTEGFRQSVLNIGRACIDFVQFDPHPDALSTVRPDEGIRSVIRQLRKEHEIGQG
jgi:hypothetical protein